MNPTTSTPPAKALSPTKQALLALQDMEAKVKVLEAAQTEPLAVIGMACRFPGDATTPAAFWELLRAGRDAIGDIPKERWDVDAYYEPDGNAAGKIYMRAGGFLRDVEQFDPHFFWISPREAASMDPQQRLLLEVAWESLENANLSAEALFNSATGVFIGITSMEYGARAIMTSALTDINAYYLTGGALGVAAGRLSYVFGFTGPSFVMDTACSSSLVALHVACQSLRQRECQMALVGGVNLMYGPETFINFCQGRMLAKNGRCKTFDAAADGYARGEGCSVIVLKRFSDAQADGDQILALVRGSAINQDGPSGGLTVPNGIAQAKVIRQALRNARIDPARVSYIEAHGTGTPLGDPIEIGALADVFHASHTRAQPLLVGAVKTNIGHLDAAAGMAGICKVLLALQHQQIPPHLHLQTPNPQIPWDRLPITIPTTLRAWESPTAPRVAGVSSFGFSGTNVHIVLEEAPTNSSALSKSQTVEERPVHILTLSAKTPDALAALAVRYRQMLTDTPNLSVADVCFTANTCRSHFPYRLAVIGASAADLAARLTAFAQQPMTAHAEVTQGFVKAGAAPQIAFVCPNDGEAPASSYSLRSLRTLLETENWKLKTPPTRFAVAYALAQVWQRWGVQPTVIAGQGSGEYLAACLAGVFSLDDALRLLAARDRALATPADAAATAKFRGVAESITYSAPNVEIITNVTGHRSGAEMATPAYWQQQLHATAPFEHNHAALAEMAAVIVNLSSPAANDVWHSVLTTLAALYTQGVAINWAAFDQNYARRKVALPNYPFQRKRYWLDTMASPKSNIKTTPVQAATAVQPTPLARTVASAVSAVQVVATQRPPALDVSQLLNLQLTTVAQTLNHIVAQQLEVLRSSQGVTTTFARPSKRES
ncbi:hypothetical protein CCP3SC5AM1_120002 [Gammaproteobacteria bacterium]